MDKEQKLKVVVEYGSLDINVTVWDIPQDDEEVHTEVEFDIKGDVILEEGFTELQLDKIGDVLKSAVEVAKVEV